MGPSEELRMAQPLKFMFNLFIYIYMYIYIYWHPFASICNEQCIYIYTVHIYLQKKIFDWKTSHLHLSFFFTASFNSYDSEVVAFDAGPPPRDWKKNASPPSSQSLVLPRHFPRYGYILHPQSAIHRMFHDVSPCQDLST